MNFSKYFTHIVFSLFIFSNLQITSLAPPTVIQHQRTVLQSLSSSSRSITAVSSPHPNTDQSSILHTHNSSASIKAPIFLLIGLVSIICIILIGFSLQLTAFILLNQQGNIEHLSQAIIHLGNKIYRMEYIANKTPLRIDTTENSITLTINNNETTEVLSEGETNFKHVQEPITYTYSQTNTTLYSEHTELMVFSEESQASMYNILSENNQYLVITNGPEQFLIFPSSQGASLTIEPSNPLLQEISHQTYYLHLNPELDTTVLLGNTDQSYEIIKEKIATDTILYQVIKSSYLSPTVQSLRNLYLGGSITLGISGIFILLLLSSFIFKSIRKVYSKDKKTILFGIILWSVLISTLFLILGNMFSSIQVHIEYFGFLLLIIPLILFATISAVIINLQRTLRSAVLLYRKSKVKVLENRSHTNLSPFDSIGGRLQTSKSKRELKLSDFISLMNLVSLLLIIINITIQILFSLINLHGVEESSTIIVPPLSNEFINGEGQIFPSETFSQELDPSSYVSFAPGTTFNQNSNSITASIDPNADSFVHEPNLIKPSENPSEPNSWNLTPEEVYKFPSSTQLYQKFRFDLVSHQDSNIRRTFSFWASSGLYQELQQHPEKIYFNGESFIFDSEYTIYLGELKEDIARGAFSLQAGETLFDSIVRNGVHSIPFINDGFGDFQINPIPLEDIIALGTEYIPGFNPTNIPNIETWQYQNLSGYEYSSSLRLQYEIVSDTEYRLLLVGDYPFSVYGPSNQEQFVASSTPTNNKTHIFVLTEGSFPPLEDNINVTPSGDYFRNFEVTLQPQSEEGLIFPDFSNQKPYYPHLLLGQDDSNPMTRMLKVDFSPTKVAPLTPNTEPELKYDFYFKPPENLDPKDEVIIVSKVHNNEVGDVIIDQILTYRTGYDNILQVYNLTEQGNLINAGTISRSSLDHDWHHYHLNSLSSLDDFDSQYLILGDPDENFIIQGQVFINGQPTISLNHSVPTDSQRVRFQEGISEGGESINSRTSFNCSNGMPLLENNTIQELVKFSFSGDHHSVNLKDQVTISVIAKRSDNNIDLFTLATDGEDSIISPSIRMSYEDFITINKIHIPLCWDGSWSSISTNQITLDPPILENSIGNSLGTTLENPIAYQINGLELFYDDSSFLSGNFREAQLTDNIWQYYTYFVAEDYHPLLYVDGVTPITFTDLIGPSDSIPSLPPASPQYESANTELVQYSLDVNSAEIELQTTNGSLIKGFDFKIPINNNNTLSVFSPIPGTARYSSDQLISHFSFYNPQLEGSETSLDTNQQAIFWDQENWYFMDKDKGTFLDTSNSSSPFQSRESDTFYFTYKTDLGIKQSFWDTFNISSSPNYYRSQLIKIAFEKFPPITSNTPQPQPIVNENTFAFPPRIYWEYHSEDPSLGQTLSTDDLWGFSRSDIQHSGLENLNLDLTPQHYTTLSLSQPHPFSLEVSQTEQQVAQHTSGIITLSSSVIVWIIISILLITSLILSYKNQRLHSTSKKYLVMIILYLSLSWVFLLETNTWSIITLSFTVVSSGFLLLLLGIITLSINLYNTTKKRRYRISNHPQESIEAPAISLEPLSPVREPNNILSNTNIFESA